MDLEFIKAEIKKVEKLQGALGQINGILRRHEQIASMDEVVLKEGMEEEMENKYKDLIKDFIDLAKELKK